MERNKKIVIFGAGKIGRSFIGQVFSGAGYQVVFVDIAAPLVDSLNEKRGYRVVVKGNRSQEVITVTNVRAVLLAHGEKVLDELAETSLAAVSVGQKGLPGVVRLLSRDLERRARSGAGPLDVIIAENIRNGDRYIRQELGRYLPPDFPVDKWAGLVEASIGRMVPLMSTDDIRQDPLQVFAEPYNSLIVSRNGFLNPVPDVPELKPKENIKAWVDRKLMIHNLGHASTAYFGFREYPGLKYIWEVLEYPAIRQKVKKAMQEAAAVLMAIHPGEFTTQQLEDHIDDLIYRFRNRNLGDTVYRVGSDLYRKLGAEDRLAAPVRAAILSGLPHGEMMDAINAGIDFRATDEEGNFHPSDVLFHREAAKGKTHILENICKVNQPLH